MSTKDSVLQALQENSGNFISGEELSNRLCISRTAVWKAIRSLRQEGYTINAVTNRGYMLMNEDGVITEAELRSFLPPRYRNNRIHVYDTTDSTNLQAKRIALENAEHGSVVVAMQQTGGRGRLGRSFFSPKNGIYLSIIIRPSFDLSRSILVTSAAAVAVADAVEAVCGKSAGIKWVNDVYVDGKKICGILTEGITDFETGQIDALIIGIGVNTSTDGFPPELLEVAGAVEGDYSPAELAAGIISRTLDLTDNIESRSFIEEYKSKSLVLGKTVKVYKGGYNTDTEHTHRGVPARVLDIDDDGCLVVLYSDGSRETRSSGEISIRF